MSDTDLDRLLDAKVSKATKKNAYGGWMRAIGIIGALAGFKFVPVGNDAETSKAMTAMWAEIHNVTNAMSAMTTNLAVMQKQAELDTKAEEDKLLDHEARLRNLEHK